MNRRDRRPRLPGRACRLTFGLLAALVLGLAGCTLPEVRSQRPDEGEPDAKYDVQTIGDVTSNFLNAEPVKLAGVGLVTGLDGTGGNAPPSGYRTMLEDDLKKRGLTNVREVLASPNNALVVVSALIPPGAQRDDPVDIEVGVPPGSKVTSLRGGVLQECLLYNYEYARNLNPEKYGQSKQALKGNALVKAGGPLIVGFGDGDADARMRQGRLWGGGRCTTDLPFFLVLDEKHQYASTAAAVANRVNERFAAAFHGAGHNEVAVARNKSQVLLTVPPQYRHNLPRYLRVVRLIPLREPAGGAAAYRHRLEEDLLNPSRTVTAALRLEALGPNSIPILKSSMARKHPLVRFCSAEALAYLDCPSCGEELAHTVEQHPVLRAFSLTALASMDEAVSHVKLRELLACPNAEARYGAFRALRALDEHDPALQGELLNKSFWVHRVAPGSPGLVHLCSSRRAEIVLFGQDAMLAPPFEFLVGDAVKFTITAGNDDEHCTVTRFSLDRAGEPVRETRQCSLKLEDLLHTLAAEGGTYPEAVALLRQVSDCRCLNCPVAVDQLPQAVSVEELALSAKNDPGLLRLDAEVLEARPDLGTTPNLYQKGALRSLADQEADEESALRDRKPRNEKQTVERVHGGIE
jgi:hypothetical protein